MSCFFGAMPTGGTYHYTSSPGRPRGGGKRPWRRWRAKCAGMAAAVGSRLRRSVVRAVDGGRRRTTPPSPSSVHRGWCHHHHHGRSFAPVYVDDLYSHNLQPAAKAHRGVVVQQEQVHESPSTSARGKLAATATAAAAAPAHAHASASGSKQQARAMATGVAAMRNVLLRSPGRGGGGGVLGVVKGMGEVDLRAELFIRKFKEDMRLQSQRSAEELQAMLARGL